MFKPLQDNVVVKAEKRTKLGSLFLLDQYQKPTKGTVVAVGPGKRNYKGELEALPLEPGQLVFFNNGFGTTPTMLDGQEYYIVNSDNILATGSTT